MTCAANLTLPAISKGRNDRTLSLNVTRSVRRSAANVRRGRRRHRIRLRRNAVRLERGSRLATHLAHGEGREPFEDQLSLYRLPPAYSLPYQSISTCYLSSHGFCAVKIQQTHVRAIAQTTSSINAEGLICSIQRSLHFSRSLMLSDDAGTLGQKRTAAVAAA